MPTADKTIAQVFEEFLSDQEQRLSPRTLSKYRTIIDLYQTYLESYWPGHDAPHSALAKFSADTMSSSAISCRAK